MQFSTIIAALCFTSAAMACANGPYETNSACAGTCDGAQRCGDDNWIIRCQNGKWQQVSQCNHCKFGACAS